MSEPQVVPLSSDVLADLPVEELEQRLEMQILRMPTPEFCTDCSCDGATYACDDGCSSYCGGMYCSCYGACGMDLCTSYCAGGFCGTYCPSQCPDCNIFIG